MSGCKEIVVVVGTYDCMVVCLNFDPEQNGLRRRFLCKGHSGSVKAVASHERWLASGSSDETIKLYDLSKCSEIGSLLQHEGSITWLSIDGNCMFSASEDGTIVVWQISTWNPLHTLTGHKGPVNCVVVHPSGKLALSVGRDRVLRVWNLSTGHLAFRQKLKEAAQLVKWSPCAEYYALAFRTTIEVYNVESGAVISSITVGKAINSFVFAQDKVVAVASEVSAIQLFSFPSGECSGKLEGHTQRVKSLAVSQACECLFSASSDGSVRAWKLAHPLKESTCVSVYETGSRLNCITLSSVTIQKQAANLRSSRVVGDQSRESSETSECLPVNSLRIEQMSDTSIRGSRQRRRRKQRVHSYVRRTTGLPFSRQTIRRSTRVKYKLKKLT